MINFDKKDVITALNREEAEIYIGEKGYYCYRNNDWRPCELVRVYLKDDDFDVRNVFTILDHKTEHECPMFLPADKVKEVEEEKKYRPFKNVDEFMNHLDFKCLMNNYIKVENKITSERYEFMIVGCFNNGIVLPLYGALIMDQLFKKFNICIDGKYQPFGVLEE